MAKGDPCNWQNENLLDTVQECVRMISTLKTKIDSLQDRVEELESINRNEAYASSYK